MRLAFGKQFTKSSKLNRQPLVDLTQPWWFN